MKSLGMLYSESPRLYSKIYACLLSVSCRAILLFKLLIDFPNIIFWNVSLTRKYCENLGNENTCKEVFFHLGCPWILTESWVALDISATWNWPSVFGVAGREKWVSSGVGAAWLPHYPLPLSGGCWSGHRNDLGPFVWSRLAGPRNCDSVSLELGQVLIFIRLSEVVLMAVATS